MLELPTIALFLFVCIIIGLKSGTKIKNIEEYAVSNRNFSLSVLITTIAATHIGGGTTIGVAEKIYKEGLIYFLVFLGWPINKLLLAKFLIPRMKSFRDEISMGGIINKMYGKPTMLITSFVSFLFCSGVIAAQFFAVLKILHALIPEYALPIFFISAIVLIVYSSVGGVKSVILTDFFQFVVLAVVFPVLVSAVIMKTGGIEGLNQYIANLQEIPLWKKESIGIYLSTFIVFCIPDLTPPMVQRLLMSKDLRKLQNAIYSATFFFVIIIFSTGLLGFIAFLHFKNLQGSEILIKLIVEFIPTGLKGFFISGLLAVVISTADSQLNSGTVLLVNDILKPLNILKGKKNDVLFCRIITLALGFLAVLLSLSVDSIMDILVFFINFWGLIIPIPFILGIFNITISEKSLLFSTAISTIVFFSCMYTKNNYTFLIAFCTNLILFLTFVLKKRFTNELQA